MLPCHDDSCQTSCLAVVPGLFANRLFKLLQVHSAMALTSVNQPIKYTAFYIEQKKDRTPPYHQAIYECIRELPGNAIWNFVSYCSPNLFSTLPLNIC